ncbi:hypothetical protein LCGC14_1271200 [marine sediment metagenome]|uniref:Uncharacterized protein n=1 Tax=marine sediment metagenome TaxID=412755 RepID=A0A0F9P121_9ZZZZ
MGFDDDFGSAPPGGLPPPAPHTHVEADITDLAHVVGAVLEADYTAKGDVLVASGASTPAALAIGANGSVLTADSAETTGAKWANPIGYPLNFGGIALIGDLGKFWEYEGESNAATDGTLDQRTEATIPKTSTLVALAWNSASGDSTTVVKGYRNGIVVVTVAWTAAFGVVAGLSVPYVQGTEKIAWEFDAGTAPGESTLTPYFEAA